MIFQVVVTPEETLFVMDHGEVRHIYTGRQGQPGKDDLWPTSLGDSIGHWESLTLVIDTVARTPGPISMFAPVAELSEQAHFTERVRRIDKNTLEDQLIIEDPARFVRPWTVTLRYNQRTRSHTVLTLRLRGRSQSRGERQVHDSAAQTVIGVEVRANE